MDHCEGCGFSYDLALAEEAGALIVSAAAHLAATVESSADPTLRPSPTTWSPLEYACHVRDVLWRSDFPTGMERSLRWVAMHTVHEVRHHHEDVQRQQPEPATDTDPRPNRTPS